MARSFHIITPKYYGLIVAVTDVLMLLLQLYAMTGKTTLKHQRKFQNIKPIFFSSATLSKKMTKKII